MLKEKCQKKFALEELQYNNIGRAGCIFENHLDNVFSPSGYLKFKKNMEKRLMEIEKARIENEIGVKIDLECNSLCTLNNFKDLYNIILLNKGKVNCDELNKNSNK